MYNILSKYVLYIKYINQIIFRPWHEFCKPCVLKNFEYLFFRD